RRRTNQPHGEGADRGKGVLGTVLSHESGGNGAPGSSRPSRHGAAERATAARSSGVVSPRDRFSRTRFEVLSVHHGNEHCAREPAATTQPRHHEYCGRFPGGEAKVLHSLGFVPARSVATNGTRGGGTGAPSRSAGGLGHRALSAR